MLHRHFRFPGYLLLLMLCVSGRLPLLNLLEGPLWGQFFDAPSRAEPELVADTTAVVPGKDFTVGIRFKIEKKWHLYWRFPGDSGAAPSVQWDLPPGLEPGPVRWPLPHALRSEGDIFTNVYEEEVLLPVVFHASPDLHGDKVTLRASLKWYVCSETCLPGEGKVSLILPVAAEGQPAPQPAHSELFELWRTRLPETRDPAPFQSRWRRSAAAVEVFLSGIPTGSNAELFPIPPLNAEAEHPSRVEEASGSVSFRIASKQAQSNEPWSALVVLNSEGGKRRGWEISEAPPDRAPSTVSQPSPGSKPASPGNTVPSGPDTPLPTPGALQEPAVDGAQTATSGGESPEAGSLAAVLWTAFLGGLIMNLMPCVLPVIALKLFHFTRQSGEDPRRVFRLGLSFCAGVAAFFLGLALAVIGLQKAGGSLNWGFQFQNPWILLGLIGAVFVFGLNLLGVFEITLSSGTNQTLSELSSREGHGGAFLHGAFTTLLGTSCTAPYLGVTLGFAASQPPGKVVLIFLTIALGMALPYLLLTANPGLLRWIPKPGAWMERLKQIMGFIILGVAVWLLGVLGESQGVEVMEGACVLLLALGVGCWTLGVLRSRTIAMVVSLVLAAASVWAFVQPALKSNAEARALGKNTGSNAPSDLEIWQPFSPERLEAELQKDKPVFVDFTASWCLNCKVNEKVTLSRTDVLEAFRAKGVVLLKADWSDGDPVITAELRKHDRVGVPLYVLYRQGETPVRFPEILKPQTLLEALKKIPSP